MKNTTNFLAPFFKPQQTLEITTTTSLVLEAATFIVARSPKQDPLITTIAPTTMQPTKQPPCPISFASRHHLHDFL